MKIEGLIIHLKRAEKRLPQVKALQSILPLPVTIIDGVDGLLLSDDEMRAVYRRRLHKPHYPFELRRTEIGCFLSHRRAWQAIVDRQLHAGLIVEDDVQPDGTLFAKVLGAAMAVVKAGDYVRFPYRSYTDKGDRVAGNDEAMLIEPCQSGLGMQMQLVGRDAAAALLRATEMFDRPVDTTIQLRAVPGVRVLAARPTCIRQIGEQLGGSVVQKKKKPLGETLSREVKRALYRLSLRASGAGRL